MTVLESCDIHNFPAFFCLAVVSNLGGRRVSRPIQGSDSPDYPVARIIREQNSCGVRKMECQATPIRFLEQEADVNGNGNGRKRNRRLIYIVIGVVLVLGAVIGVIAAARGGDQD